MSDPAGRGAIVLLGPIVLATSCSSASVHEPTSSSARPAPTTAASPIAPAGSRTVRFEAVDGVEFEGRLFGAGSTGIVLSHMGNAGDSEADWYGVAEILADRGYAVLTYDRRGVCPGGIDGCFVGERRPSGCVEGRAGAVRFLTRRGAGEVFVGGASIGAMACLYAAKRSRIDVAGVIWIAGLDFASGYEFQRGDVRQVAAPTLFVSAIHDPYGAAESARRLHRWANPPTSLVVLRSDAHGTDVLGDPAAPKVAEALTRSIVRFVDRFAS